MQYSIYRFFMNQPKKRGRPTKYKPEFCELLIEHMASGLSFESFGGLDEVEVWKDVLYDWVKLYPDFSNAKRLGFQKNRKFWEKLGRDHILNESESFGNGQGSKSKSLNATVWIFNMKNRFPEEWREKKEIEQNSTVQFTEHEANTIGSLSERAAAFLEKKK